ACDGPPRVSCRIIPLWGCQRRTISLGDLSSIVERVIFCASVKMLLLIVSISSVGFLFGQSARVKEHLVKFSNLSKEDSERLDKQRLLIGDVVKQRYGATTLTRTSADLPVLQRLIDDGIFDKSQTYQLQCLGVAFGDVLASEMPLRWAMITDEYGSDPTLRFKKTEINVNALTMISKRFERGERVNLSWLLLETRKQVSATEHRVK
ncbi:MAG: DUF3806 domain-containing protein, partial [Terriglobales bacterium]